jgi:Large polyvalent protein associated domain 23
MNDRYWPYWMSSATIDVPKTPSDPWRQDIPPATEIPSGGILGKIGQLVKQYQDGDHVPTAQKLPTFAQSFTRPASWFAFPLSGRNQNPLLGQPTLRANVEFPAPHSHVFNQPTGLLPDNNGVTAPIVPAPPPPPTPVPFYGPGDVLRPQPEPAPPAPQKDFRSWLRDALSDRNIRYYAGPGFYEALQKLHALTKLLPGSGSVQSMEDTSHANQEARAGNYGKAAVHLGMGTTNVALDWVPGSQLAIIAGTMARTFPWQRLRTAMTMEAAGRSVDEIWRATGLERAADGRWTFEISDKGFRVHPNVGERVWGSARQAPLYEHYTHPGMREAYPQLANRPSLLVVDPLERGLGRVWPYDKVMVRAPNLQTAKSLAMHELKHLIDEVEKHPPGGQWKQFMGPGVSEQEARDIYWRLIGEVAARNAQRRLEMSERQRRLRSPQRTESVPRDQQINLYDD